MEKQLDDDRYGYDECAYVKDDDDLCVMCNVLKDFECLMCDQYYIYCNFKKTAKHKKKRIDN
jgi:hypothetical protein